LRFPEFSADSSVGGGFGCKRTHFPDEYEILTPAHGLTVFYTEYDRSPSSACEAVRRLPFWVGRVIFVFGAEKHEVGIPHNSTSPNGVRGIAQIIGNKFRCVLHRHVRKNEKHLRW